ncbi:MAG TPA: hypothetical protein VE398_18125 [Acidobacteriota bacterium]|nr:hypothetical protein [Acidobacteriota bacterium]
MSVLAFLLYSMLQTAKPAPVQGMPAAAGAYYRQDDAKWVKLESPATAKSKTKGMGMFIETAGLSNLDMTTVYQGAHASVQISNSRPTFYVRGTVSPKDAAIVQLAQKKDSRSVQTSSAAATVDNKGGFKKGELRKVIVTVYSDNSFSVMPEGELKSGEYLLAFGNSDTGFDFSISAAKK